VGVPVSVYIRTRGQGQAGSCVRDLEADCLVCRITSMPHYGFLDYAASDSKSAGLDRPSTIRLSRLVTIEKSLLRARIGSLSDADREAIRSLWNEKFRL
jgi:mRNA interferase MazF